MVLVSDLHLTDERVARNHLHHVGQQQADFIDAFGAFSLAAVVVLPLILLVRWKR